MIGSVIDGKYTLVSKLGSGAMGDVLEGRNVATARRVAIKLINQELANDEALVARFQREARAAGAIESRHIAQVLDAGRDPASGSPYLVMELLEGGDLQSLLERLGPLRPGLATRLVAQAVAGLERAHAANVVHRDIKPANLYLATTDGGTRVVKVVDFGIAKVKDDLAASQNHALTQTSAILGSPLYMSPEQAKQSRNVDARADLWSMGIVFYQLLTAQTPHQHAETLTELLLAICTEQARPVQQVAPWVPPEIAQIVDRALNLDASRRFQTASEMLAALQSVVPDWQLVNDAMLTRMTTEERAAHGASVAAAPVGATTGPAARTGPTTGSGTAILSAHAVSTPDAPGFAASQSSPGAQTTPPRARSRAPLVVGLAAAAMLTGIGGVAYVVKSAGRAVATPGAGLVPPVASTSEPSVGATPSAAVSAATATTATTATPSAEPAPAASSSAAPTSSARAAAKAASSGATKPGGAPPAPSTATATATTAASAAPAPAKPVNKPVPATPSPGGGIDRNYE